MRLGKLENLELSGNRLNSSILSILSGLSSLKSLDLSDTMLTGSGIIHSFYLNASHDVLLIILFLCQEKWGLCIKKRGTWNEVQEAYILFLFWPFYAKSVVIFRIRRSLQNSPINIYFIFIFLNKYIFMYVFSVLRYLRQL